MMKNIFAYNICHLYIFYSELSVKDFDLFFFFNQVVWFLQMGQYFFVYFA